MFPPLWQFLWCIFTKNLQVGPLISTQALSATHLVNDKVRDSHGVYQIPQKICVTVKALTDKVA